MLNKRIKDKQNHYHIYHKCLSIWNKSNIVSKSYVKLIQFHWYIGRILGGPRANLALFLLLRFNSSSSSSSSSSRFFMRPQHRLQHIPRAPTRTTATPPITPYSVNVNHCGLIWSKYISFAKIKTYRCPNCTKTMFKF